MVVSTVWDRINLDGQDSQGAKLENLRPIDKRCWIEKLRFQVNSATTYAIWESKGVHHSPLINLIRSYFFGGVALGWPP